MKAELFSNWEVLWSSNMYKDLLDTPSDNDKEQVDFEPLVAVLQKEKRHKPTTEETIQNETDKEDVVEDHEEKEFSDAKDNKY